MINAGLVQTVVHLPPHGVCVSHIRRPFMCQTDHLWVQPARAIAFVSILYKRIYACRRNHLQLQSGSGYNAQWTISFSADHIAFTRGLQKRGFREAVYTTYARCYRQIKLFVLFNTVNGAACPISKLRSIFFRVLIGRAVTVVICNKILIK